ncbi:hypothetical protein [Curtobacterium sp. Leaf261]|uniref:hypothetical protein n=1 Tax=Curtobacterium sp. Leaf261 TaxID=1736311 RepID=UPI0006FC1F57|nr:hypothetical protein [Curtobacterium sp. Leaf261]KQO65002.1 hypothetical protein ASF23_02295 [Curtobacterium sp. Leaf261]
MRPTRRRTLTALVAVALAVLTLTGCAAPGSAAHTAFGSSGVGSSGVGSSGVGSSGVGSSDTVPVWPAPTGLSELQRHADAADLHDVWGRKLAEHIHAHLSITDDGVPITVPGNIGHSDRSKFAAEIHTHDTSGIVHVETPTKQDFTLGQFFTEWGVDLGRGRIGELVGLGHGGSLTVWVDGHRYYGDPADIELGDLQQIDLAITHVGHVARQAPSFDWPPQYH